MIWTSGHPANTVRDCHLCFNAGGRLVWTNDDWRVVGVDDPGFPVFYRLISSNHIAEFSMLEPSERAICIQLICAVEGALLQHERPASINLASFGNVVPHLHWHIIARFTWDSHFPEPVWGAPQRSIQGLARDHLRHSVPELDKIVRSALNYASMGRNENEY